MTKDPDNIVMMTEDWLKEPLASNGVDPVSVSNELINQLLLLMQQDPALKQRLGILVGKIKGMQKAIGTLEKVHWIPVMNGTLSIGHRPSAKLGGDLKLQNATHILTLLSEKEGALPIRSIAQKNGMEWLWFAMDSAKPPAEDRWQELARLFGEMSKLLEEGGQIYIHCSAGIHRTGMISYAFLRFIGMDPQSARSMLQELRTTTHEGVGEDRLQWVDSVCEDLKNR